jgi:hypothetical protein
VLRGSASDSNATVYQLDYDQPKTARNFLRVSADELRLLDRYQNAIAAQRHGKRKKHRSSGWMGSAVRVILRNELYTGVVKWNQTRHVRDPSTERIVRRAGPRSEWITYRDESLLIISEGTFAKAQAIV